MTNLIEYPKESSGRIKIFESHQTSVTSTETTPLTRLLGGNEAFTDHALTPAKHTEIGDLIAQYERDPAKRAALEDARSHLARTAYAGSATTVRTMRLRRGWSQVRLAQLLGTSQSHVARIERGQDNLTLQTCRKLCNVLGVDLNALDEALRAQEESKEGSN